MTVIKLNLIALFVLPIVVSLMLQKVAAKGSIIGSIIQLPIKGLALALGLWSVDDGNFVNWLNKNRGKGKIILSNSVSILDAFYYMSMYV